ncbi:hypothetical protein GLYMA_15G071300v4 [Glycine max]|uniref:DUF3700 domain-containing protein n=1 Tax=Glycine max TaxID=3847 RepID=I1MEE8_SOYBN|nr:hypothetical protein GLYMA_15G071300v4 [Glycine max]
MLGIFKQKLVNAPKELNSPASLNSCIKPKLSHEILKDFMSCNSSNAFSMCFGNDALLAYSTSYKPSINHRLFSGLDNIYCVFLGGLHNLSMLNKQYGLSKGTNEAMFIIEAYRTLRDRGPYPADQVLKELEGSFAFVIYDNKDGTVFVASGSNGHIELYWGIAGCMFHSEHGLMNFEHPTQKMKAMPRIDSEGVMCGANFNVDSQSKIQVMPRVGSEANWATWG